MDVYNVCLLGSLRGIGRTQYVHHILDVKVIWKYVTYLPNSNGDNMWCKSHSSWIVHPFTYENKHKVLKKNPQTSM